MDSFASRNEPIALTRPQVPSAEILKEDKSNSSANIATTNTSCTYLHVSTSPCTIVDDIASVYSDDTTSSSDPPTPGSTTSLSFDKSPPLPLKDKCDLLHLLSLRREGSHNNDVESFHPPTHQQLHQDHQSMTCTLLPSALIMEHMDSSLSSQPCIKVTDYDSYNWSLNDGVAVRYQQIINFGRNSSPRNIVQGQGRGGCLGFWDGSNEQDSSCGNTIHTCVMCGLGGVHIPSQNKDVCKTCDSSFWYCKPFQVIVKFCKGCKNFVTLKEFDEKPYASKCGRCRYRGRMNYVSKKCNSSNASSPLAGGDSSPVNFDNTFPRSKGRSDKSVQHHDSDDDDHGDANGGNFIVNAKLLAKNSSTASVGAGNFPPPKQSNVFFPVISDSNKRLSPDSKEKRHSDGFLLDQSAINLLHGMQRVTAFSTQQQCNTSASNQKNEFCATTGANSEYYSDNSVDMGNISSNDNSNNTINITNNVITVANSSNSGREDNVGSSNDSNSINVTGSGCFATYNQKRKRQSIQSIFDNLGNKKAACEDHLHDGEEVDNGKSASFASAAPSSTLLSISSPLLTSVVQGRRNSESSLLLRNKRSPQQKQSASLSEKGGNAEFDRSRMFNRSGSFDATINPTKPHDDPLMHLALISETLLTLP